MNGLVQVSLPESIQTELGISVVHDTFHGGQKTVFIVTMKNQKVALKIFPRGMQERDIREVEFYKSHAHLNGIPRLIDVREISGHPIVIEEFIDGACLNNIVENFAGKHMPIAKLLNDICTIMEPVWDEDFIHRDLKPHNIMISPDGQPVVID